MKINVIKSLKSFLNGICFLLTTWKDIISLAAIIRSSSGDFLTQSKEIILSTSCKSYNTVKLSLTNTVLTRYPIKDGKWKVLPSFTFYLNYGIFSYSRY